ncbi:hypothetical protein GCM10008967_13550 [Bacillus carboniphilus]|uniref:YueH-like protein n=1 Tax=Bacillus carboniphilus TaxID=86663 RepID=A0ABP3FRZ2_9BACI
MKIRRTVIEEKESKVFLYENRKEFFFLVALPDYHWSDIVTYEDSHGDILERMKQHFPMKLQPDTIESVASQIYQWTREM